MIKDPGLQMGKFVDNGVKHVYLKNEIESGIVTLVKLWLWMDSMHGSPKGPFFLGTGPYRDLFGFLGPYLYFKVPIFNVLVKFTQRMSIQSAFTQQWVKLICAV